MDLADDVRRSSVAWGGEPASATGFLAISGSAVGVGRSLTFRVVSCTVPEQFEVYWKIKNTGQEAAQVGQLRGEIVPDDGSRSHQESTLYRGEHYVECYVVKGGLVRARTRHRVVII